VYLLHCQKSPAKKIHQGHQPRFWLCEKGLIRLCRASPFFFSGRWVQFGQQSPNLPPLNEEFGGSARRVGSGRDCGDVASAGCVIVVAALEWPAIVSGLDEPQGRLLRKCPDEELLPHAQKPNSSITANMPHDSRPNVTSVTELT
jgi:hypothetical protein